MTTKIERRAILAAIGGATFGAAAGVAPLPILVSIGRAQSLRPGSLAKENAGRQATDQEFAEALELQFWIDEETELLHLRDGTVEPATHIELCLWDQLRHSYGFAAVGTCNSRHYAQLEREGFWDSPYTRTFDKAE